MLTISIATSALDAESETLVNSALASLVRGNNTTISIAHRLSTIKRADQIIVLSAHGTVAEQGTYAQLTAHPDSAFMKLMEWQISGGDPPPSVAAKERVRGPPTEVETETGAEEEVEEVEERAQARAEGNAGTGEENRRG